MAQVPLDPEIRKVLESDTAVQKIQHYKLVSPNGKTIEEGWIYESHYSYHPFKERHPHIIQTKVGFWKYYRANGTIEADEFVPLSDTALHIVNIYRRNGQLKRQQVYRNSENPRKIAEGDKFGLGKLKNYRNVSYYRNGVMSSSVKMIGFKFIGPYLRNYKNGNPEYRWNYNLDGNLDGTSTSYYESGAIRFKATYRNGELVGEAIKYSENGEILNEEKK